MQRLGVWEDGDDDQCLGCESLPVPLDSPSTAIQIVTQITEGFGLKRPLNLT